jgi:hypothetical protein
MARLLVVTDSQWHRSAKIAGNSAFLASAPRATAVVLLRSERRSNGGRFLFRRYSPSPAIAKALWHSTYRPWFLLVYCCLLEATSQQRSRTRRRPEPESTASRGSAAKSIWSRDDPHRRSPLPFRSLATKLAVPLRPHRPALFLPSGSRGALHALADCLSGLCHALLQVSHIVRRRIVHLLLRSTSVCRANY